MELDVLKAKAQPLYIEHGQNSWDHVLQVCENMQHMTLELEGRLLELPEWAAGLFHDCSIKPRMEKVSHGYWSAEIANHILKQLVYFSDEELRRIHTAIYQHDVLDKKGGPFDSLLGDLLASGDCNPPDVAWICNKSWCWGIKNGLTQEQRIANIVTRMPEFYGSNAKTGYPSYYRRYYKDRLAEMQRVFDTITPEKVYEIVVEYRQSHGIEGDTILMPNPE